MALSCLDAWFTAQDERALVANAKGSVLRGSGYPQGGHESKAEILLAPKFVLILFCVTE